MTREPPCYAPCDVVAESLDAGIQLERPPLPGVQSEQTVYVTTSTMYCELGRLSKQFKGGVVEVAACAAV